MIHLAALVFYIAAFAPWVVLLVRGANEQASRVAIGLTVAAVVLHAMALVDFWITTGELPLVGIGAVASTIAFVGGVSLVLLASLRDVGRIALGLLPFVIGLQAAALVLGIEPAPMSLDFQGAGFVLHVALAILGLQGLTVAAAAGFLYVVQHHELKEKRLGRLFVFLPPLATLERAEKISLGIGFVSLSLSLVVGWAWTVQNRGSLEFGDPKVLWAVLSWFVFLAIFIAGRGKSASEYRTAVATVIGFAVVIGTYLALRITAGGTGLFL